MFSTKKIGDNTGEKDILNSVSKLFEINSWQTKNKVVVDGIYIASKNRFDEKDIELFRKLVKEFQAFMNNVTVTSND